MSVQEPDCARIKQAKTGQLVFILPWWEVVQGSESGLDTIRHRVWEDSPAAAWGME